MLLTGTAHWWSRNSIRAPQTAMPGPILGLFFLLAETSNSPGGQLVTFPVFIPTIPQFLNSYLDFIAGRLNTLRESCVLPQIEVDYLARYLVLGLLHWQDKLLAKVNDRERLVEYFTDRQRRQEGRVKRVGGAGKTCGSFKTRGKGSTAVIGGQIIIC